MNGSPHTADAAPLDVLFVHEGKECDPRTPIRLLPMGVPAMADWLARRGRTVEIVHHALERCVDGAFDLVDHVARTRARVLCLDLHWHAQSRAVVELARRIRASLPDLPVVLGGYTASAFATEILEDYPWIDVVVRGDGEVALAALVDALLDGGPLDRVPNLVYRGPDGVRESAARQVNDAADLARFRYAAFDALRHRDAYCRAGVMEGRLGPAETGPGIFYCNCGRGCPYDCVFCGGSRSAQRRIACREEVVYRPVEAMVADLARMEGLGLATWYNTFHPSPDESYFLELFEAVRERGLRIGMIHECLHLPSERFVETFARTFGPVRRLDFVVLTGSEALRRASKGNPLDGADLLERLAILAAYGVDADLCFLTGLPGETAADHQQSLEYVARARRRHPGVRVNAELLAIEPLAPMNVAPEAHGIRSHARSFRDYVAAHESPDFVGYDPVCVRSAEARERAREIREAGRRRPSRVRRVGGGGERIQLHDVRLRDGGEAYGLGIPFLVAHARSDPELRERLAFEHHSWLRDPAGPDPAEVASTVLDGRPLAVGVTLTTWSAASLLEAMARVRAAHPDLPILAGGPLATCLGATLLHDHPAIDAVVTGYGERPFAALLRALIRGVGVGDLQGALEGSRGIFLRDGDGIVGRPQRPADVLPPDGVPSPYRQGVVDRGQGPAMLVEWARGCAGRCAYCAWHNALPRVVPASLERVVDDLRYAREQGIVDLILAEAALNDRGPALGQLCRVLAAEAAEGDLRFTGFLRHETLEPVQIEALVRVPFRRLNLGLQTDDARQLEILGRPPLDREAFERAVDELSRFTRVGVQIISGLPGDTYDRFQRRLHSLLQLDCDISVFPLQVPPGTRLWQQRRELGIDPDPRWEYLVLETPEMSAREHRRCLELAARLTDREGREAHGVSAPAVLAAGLAHRATLGPPLVQLHHENVDDAGAIFGLGVPFLIAHARVQADLAGRFELEQVDWDVDHPDRFRSSLDEMTERVLRDDPVLVGFSLSPWSIVRFLELIREIRRRRPGLPILVGGPNAGIEGAALMQRVPEIDLLVPDEGELPFADLLRAIAAAGGVEGAALDGVPGLLFRRDGVLVEGPTAVLPPGGLDYCGDPLGDGLVHLRADGGQLNVEWTRGCPNRCTYCAWPRRSRGLRRFGEARIRADVEWAVRHGFDEVLICDAAINHSATLIDSLCRILAKAGADGPSFSAFVDWTRVTRDQVAMLEEVRWSRLMVGLQTDDDEGLVALGRPRFDRRGFERSIELLSRITRPYVELMTGIPGDTAAKIEARVSYALSLGCRVSMFPLLATRGTGIWESCRRLGAHLDPDQQWVVRGLPTLGEEDYRRAIEGVAALGRGDDELELAGYHFLGIGPQAAVDHGGGFAAGTAPGIALVRTEQLVRNWRSAGSVAGSPDWWPADQVQPVRRADLDGARITFARDGRELAVDAYVQGRLSSPLAMGASLAFCPADDAAEPALALDLCQRLARLDRELGDE